jgi:hypothetical protein
MFKHIVMYDTDEFIQHHTKEGKQLLKLDKAEKWAEYKSLWKQTIKAKIDEFVSAHPGKVIVFVGSLDNFAPPNTIHDIDADYKFVLDVPLNELMRRYYSRIYLTDQKSTKKQSADYWNKLASGDYNVTGSAGILKDHAKYNKWHRAHNYVFLDAARIIGRVKRITDAVIAR